VSPEALFAALSRAAPEGAVIAVDVGNHAYDFGRLFECREGQRVLMSGYLGSIGFGLPAAIGAWAAVGGGRRVFAVVGDGGLGQHLADFTTAVRHGMEITLVVVRNGELGKISKEQRDGGWPVWETGLLNPDFSRFARLCGAEGARVSSPAALEGALDRAARARGTPFLLEVVSPA